MTSLTIIVPTLGRPMLERTLLGIAGQLHRDDELIVVSELNGGDRARVRSIVAELGDVRWTLEECEGGDWGHSQRNLALGLASGDLIASIDDDDVYFDGALSVMRSAGTERPTIFRMRSPGLTLWQEKELRVGNVGTPKFVVPNTPGARR